MLSLLLKFGLALGVMLKRMTKSKYILRYRPCYTLCSNELTSKQTVKENAAFATTMQRKYASVQSIYTPKINFEKLFSSPLLFSSGEPNCQRTYCFRNHSTKIISGVCNLFAQLKNFLKILQTCTNQRSYTSFSIYNVWGFVIPLTSL